MRRVMKVHPRVSQKYGSKTNVKSNKWLEQTNVKPKSDVGPLSLLAASLRHQTTEFFNNSTLHGVRYIAEKERPFCEK